MEIPSGAGDAPLEILREQFGNSAVELLEMENYGNSQWSQGLTALYNLYITV